MSAAVILNLREGERGSRQLAYTEPAVVTLGRGADCTVVLQDPADPPALSRRHCELEIAPPRLWVRDLGSKNGTLLNGKRLEASAVPVVSGDEIALGDVTVEVTVNLAVSCTHCENTWIETLSGAAPESPSRACVDCSKTLVAPTAGGAPRRSLAAPAIPGFEVERELGRGGMGVVFLARRAGKPVALKVLLPEKMADERMRALFVRELSLVRRLEHPNIVRLLESGEHDGSQWMATEYCAGGTLDALQVKRGGQIPIAEAVGLVCQALAGLEHGHEQCGLVHRDFKPQNLLLARDVVKIADYGLAKAYGLAGLSGLTSTGQVGGTPFFMSRWQAVNYKYAGPEVDVWSAAATLYYMITGAAPRDFVGPHSWMETVIKSLPVKIRVRRSDVPSALAQVIDAALFDFETPAYPTARGLREALAAS